MSKVIVIGGGAAGMMAALKAAKNGHDVTLLEKNEKLGKKLFIKEAQKIIPSLTLEDLTYASGFGGIRPQVLDKQAKKLVLGERKIKSGEGITFNMTPSPGATSCMRNALIDMLEITEYLNASIKMDKIKTELNEESLEWLID